MRQVYYLLKLEGIGEGHTRFGHMQQVCCLLKLEGIGGGHTRLGRMQQIYSLYPQPQCFLDYCILQNQQNGK